VNAQLHADFAANIQQGCSPLIVQFTDLSTGHPTNWLWDLGNGAVSTLKNPGATYVNPGVYTVKLHIKDNSGNQDSIVKVDYITVYENPAVAITAFPTQGCAPLKVQFTDASNAGSGTLSQWFWDFGDGNISEEENPLHIYNNTGSFNVSLTVQNSFGCRKTMQASGLIKISGTLKADFSYSYDNACKAPATVRFTNLSQSQTTINSKWSFGDGFASTDKNPVHIYSTSGNFTVQLVTINATGCSDTATHRYRLVLQKQISVIRMRVWTRTLFLQMNQCQKQSIKNGILVTAHQQQDQLFNIHMLFQALTRLRLLLILEDVMTPLKKR